MCPLLARPLFWDQAADHRTVIAKIIYSNKSEGYAAYLEAGLISLRKCLILSVRALLVHKLADRGANHVTKAPRFLNEPDQARNCRLISWTAETMAVTASGGVN